jgi:hypothetical protein
MHKRAQTANPGHKHKHQETVLKEIKTAIQMEKMDAAHAEKRQTIHGAASQHRSRPRRTVDSTNASPFARRILEIERLNSREGRAGFSLEKDQGRICKAGWSEFGEKMERATHCNLQKIRKKVLQLRSKASVSTIFTKNWPKDCPQPDGVDLSEEPLRDLWNMVKGSEKMAENERYFRVSDLRKDISQSYVLRNAYHLCLNSKKYKDSAENSFVEQKFKSFVYLHENENKLSKKRLDELLKDNYFLA